MSRIITIVSGLPRSGTSLMMQMLDRGGMEVVIDDARTPDINNPKGYYEFEKVKKIRKDSSWLKHTRGKALKMVSMLLYNLPSDETYKIIFMKRDMRELLVSQRKMLERLNKGSDTDDDEMGVLFSVHLNNIADWLKRQKNMNILYVNYNSLIADPLSNAEMVNEFLDMELKTEEMIGAVDGKLYRNRLASLY